MKRIFFAPIDQPLVTFTDCDFKFENGRKIVIPMSQFMKNNIDRFELLLRNVGNYMWHGLPPNHDFKSSSDTNLSLNLSSKCKWNGEPGFAYKAKYVRTKLRGVYTNDDNYYECLFAVEYVCLCQENPNACKCF